MGSSDEVNILTESYPITLTHTLAWYLRERMRPGAIVGEFPNNDARKMVRDFRLKINAVLLRFQDEEGLEEVDLQITSPEGWMIDHTLDYDGMEGNATRILVQVFRGMWKEEMGLEFDVVDDPQANWANPQAPHTKGEGMV